MYYVWGMLEELWKPWAISSVNWDMLNFCCEFPCSFFFCYYFCQTYKWGEFVLKAIAVCHGPQGEFRHPDCPCRTSSSVVLLISCLNHSHLFVISWLIVLFKLLVFPLALLEHYVQVMLCFVFVSLFPFDVICTIQSLFDSLSIF